MGGQAAPSAVSAAIARRTGGGQALPQHVASDLGTSLLADFSRVRIHADSEADTIARSVQATAFTRGSDIYFSRGSYSPDTTTGRSLLAHELTHVRQHNESSGSGGGGGLTVGRADDPAEREAEQVARQVATGAQVSPGTGARTPAAARRTFSAPMRRLVGLTRSAPSGRATSATDEEAIPGAFVDLADTLQAVPQLAGKSLAWTARRSTTPTTFGSTNGGMIGLGAVGVLGAAKQGYSSGKEVHEARGNLAKGKVQHDFGLGGGATGDSLSKNLGAVQMESGVTGLLDTAGSGTGSVSSIVKGAVAKEIPFIDVATNVQQAAVKGKKAIEDGVAAHKLGRQKPKIKREGDQFLPEDIRAARFGEFATEIAKGKKGNCKSDDRKRWPTVKAAWEAGPGTAHAGFDPLTATWTGALTPAHTAFLAFLPLHGKDFGYGTKWRKQHELSLKGGNPDGPRTAGGQDYEQMRDLGKVASFGHRRKAETSTVNAVEAAGSAADAAGTFTAAGDLGATKVTGKLLKAGAAAYTGVKSLVKRGRRVHKLRQAKNEMAYGGKADRGVGWGIKQFFGGNVEGSQKKARGALKAAVKAGDTHAAAAAQHQLDTIDWQQRKDAYDQWVTDNDAHTQAAQEHQQYLADLAAHQQAEQAFLAQKPASPMRNHRRANLMAHLQQQYPAPAPAVVPDPGPAPAAVADPGPAPVAPVAPTTGAKGAGKSAKVMTAAQAAPLIKKLTLQCRRKIDDLIACLLSDNDKVRHRAKQILHIIAETNLAGALAKIEDSELDALHQVKSRMNTDATYAATHAAAFKQRTSAIKEIVSKQLAGIGG